MVTLETKVDLELCVEIEEDQDEQTIEDEIVVFYWGREKNGYWRWFTRWRGRESIWTSWFCYSRRS